MKLKSRLAGFKPKVIRYDDRCTLIRLSEEARKNIEKLIKEKKLTTTVDKLCNWVDPALGVMKEVKEEKPTIADAKQIRQDLAALVKVINGLHPDTKELLEVCYADSYPMSKPAETDEQIQHIATAPIRVAGRTKNSVDLSWYQHDIAEVQTRVLGQSKKTHFQRIDQRGMLGLHVQIEELLHRIQQAATVALEVKPKEGRRLDSDLVILVEMIAISFEFATGNEASSNPTGTFTRLVDIILNDAAPDAPYTHKDKKRLIDAALQNSAIERKNNRNTKATVTHN